MANIQNIHLLLKQESNNKHSVTLKSELPWFTPSMDKIFLAFFPTKLILNLPTVNPIQGNSFTVNGTADIWHFSNQAIVVTVNEINQKIQLEIDFLVNDEWTIKDKFNFKEGYFINYMHFSQSKFHIESSTEASPPPPVVNLSGDVKCKKLPKIFSLIDIFSSSAKQFNGTISSLNPLKFDIKINGLKDYAVAQNLNLKDVTYSLVTNWISYQNEGESETIETTQEYCNIDYSLKGTLDIDNKVNLKVATEVPVVATSFRLNGQFSEGNGEQVSFSDLATVIGNSSDLFNEFPPFLKNIGNDLTFNAFDITFDVHPFKIFSTKFEFGVNKTFNLFPSLDIFQISKLDFSITIYHPFDSNRRKITFSVSDQFLIDQYPIDFFCYETQNDEFYLAANSVIGHSIHINNLISHFLPSGIPHSIPDHLTTIQQFSFNGFLAKNGAHFKPKNYKLFFVVGDNWDVGDHFILEKITFQVERNLSTHKITGFVMGYFSMHNTEFEVTVSKQGGSWIFNGYTFGDFIEFGHFFTEVTTHFRTSFPHPAILKSAYIGDVSLVFNGNTHQFDFKGTVIFDLEGHSFFTINLQFDVHKQRNKNKIQFTGTIKIRECIFTITFAHEQATKFTASWKEKNDKFLYLTEIISFFGFENTDVPDDLNLALKQASFSYEKTANGDKTIIISAKSKNDGDAIFAIVTVGSGTTKKNIYFGGLGVSRTGINLTNLPLINSYFPNDDSLGINKLTIDFSSAEITPAEATMINNLISSGEPKVPAAGTTGKLMLAADLQLGSQTKPVAYTFFPFPSSSIREPSALDASPAPAAPNSQVKWFTIQKSFGPVTFEKMGIAYHDQKLWLLLDAGLSVGNLGIELMGLSVGTSLQEFRPVFHLDGLGINFQSEALQIAGAFINKTQPGSDSFDFEGTAVITTKAFGMGAIGQYVKKNEVSSLFLFAEAEGTFGGPPVFFVTGLAAGFGYNSQIRAITNYQEAQNFPLLKFGQEPNLAGLIDSLTQGTTPWIKDKAGARWLAAGVQFNSFKLIHSEALILAEFGQEFILSLLGFSKAQFPQNAEHPYANIELDYVATYDPSAGFLKIDAGLSNTSFVINPSCLLTGGMAFYSWFGTNTHNGDFVFTVGGYNSNPSFFKRPAWYPNPKRLGFDWQIGAHLSISGKAYFALTPREVFAGAYMGAAYNQKFWFGSLRVGFHMSFDALIQYSPFFYHLNVSASIHAALTVGWGYVSHTFRVSLSATGTIWGPPTGATLTFGIDSHSISIAFGSSENAVANNNYLKKFHGGTGKSFTDLLPNAENIAKLKPLKGLIPNHDTGTSLTAPSEHETRHFENSDATASDWLVSPDVFRFSFSNAIPITSIKINGHTTPFNGNQFTITPMGGERVGTLSTMVTITITCNSTHQNPFVIQKVDGNLPTALWEKTGSGTTKRLEEHLTGPVTTKHLEEHLTGLVFKPPAPHPINETPFTPSPQEILPQNRSHILPFKRNANVETWIPVENRERVQPDAILAFLDNLPDNQKPMVI
ncbi:MAG: DUF6603 domain-containing protein [Bacteroidota bacterium]